MRAQHRCMHRTRPQWPVSAVLLPADVHLFQVKTSALKHWPIPDKCVDLLHAIWPAASCSSSAHAQRACRYNEMLMLLIECNDDYISHLSIPLESMRHIKFHVLAANTLHRVEDMLRAHCPDALLRKGPTGESNGLCTCGTAV